MTDKIIVQKDMLREGDASQKASNFQAYRLWLHEDNYNGTYKKRLWSPFGYSKEYKESESFSKLVNRLQITNRNMYENFKSCHKKYLEECVKNQIVEEASLGVNPVEVLLEDFQSMNTHEYNQLYARTKNGIYALVDDIGNEYKEFVNDFIAYTVPENRKNDQYGALSEYINNNRPPNLSTENILKIRKLRKDIEAEEKALNLKLKQVKKAINHYLHFIKYKKRIKKNAKSRLLSTKYYNEDDDMWEAVESIYQIKKENMSIAESCATFTGFGEGNVAGVAMYVFLIGLGLSAPMSLPIAIITGLSGVFCNYYLVKNDIYDILNQIRVKNFFGKINGVKKDLCILFGSSSLATGFVYAALSAMQLYHGLAIPLFTAMGFHHALLFGLSMSLSVLPVGFTAVGLAAVFYFVISDFIVNDRWIGIKNYFLENFIDRAWSELTFKKRVKEAVICFLKVTKILFGLGLNAAITVASFGVFHKNGVMLLSTVSNLTVAQTLGFVCAIINAVIGTTFGVAKIDEMLDRMTSKAFLLFMLKSPYYITVFILAALYKTICLIPEVLLLGLTSVWWLPLNVITHVVQIIPSLIFKALAQTFQLPKSLFLGGAALISLSLFLVYGALEFARASLSLPSRLLIFSCIHENIDKFFNYFTTKIYDLAKNIFEVAKTQKLVTKYPDAQKQFDEKIKWWQDSVTDVRRSGNVVFKNVHCVGMTVFDKSTDWMNSKKQREKEQQGEYNQYRDKVTFFHKDLNRVGTGTVVANGGAQAALMVGGAGPLEGIFGKTAADVIVAISEFIYSSSPNQIATIDALDKQMRADELNGVQWRPMSIG